MSAVDGARRSDRAVYQRAGARDNAGTGPDPGTGAVGGGSRPIAPSRPGRRDAASGGRGGAGPDTVAIAGWGGVCYP